jgi:hypothetical protein
VFSTPTPRAANAAPTGTRFTRIWWDGVQVTLGWRTTAGHTYRVETTGDLAQPTWIAVGADVVATTASASVNVDFGGATNQFFRIVQIN